MLRSGQIVRANWSMYLILASLVMAVSGSVTMNPAALVCTCKGYRMIGLCSHVMTVTATYILDKECHGGGKTYDQEDLEQLVTKKRTSHRPHAVVGGAHIQPHGDSEDESEPGDEDLDEDLSAI